MSANLQDLHDSTLRILDALNIPDEAFENDGWADLACNRISMLRRRIAELTEEKRQIIVGFEAVNEALATARLSAGGT